MSPEEILAHLTALRQADLPTHGGRLFAYVYDPDVEGLDLLAGEAHRLASHTNGLDPTAFPSLLSLENDLVGAAATLLSAPPSAVGNVTSGGTESIILAVKAARDASDVDAPRLVMPVTAHAAFAKACAYLRVALDVVPVDPATLRVDPALVAAAVTPSTVLVVASAPAYAHGLVDPVAEIAAVAAERGVRCHVDACFGGWVLPYLRRLGVPLPEFDFAVDGVTSMSVDLHKYAYAPKGVSVLLHRTEDLRAPQYFGYAGWPGYTMVNPVVSSTRSGGPIAGAWATVRYLGDDGYLALATRTLEAVQALREAVESAPGLRLLPCDTTVVAFTSDEVDLFVLADELAVLGWHGQVQFSLGEIPRSIHLTVTAAVAPAVDDFTRDLPVAVAAARSFGRATVPDVSDMSVPGLMAAFGVTDGRLPTRMAPINALLETLPPEVREQVLVGFLSYLQHPTRA
jgi:glutamate/tyrosine decarboxylase-like PLP-dependent enzyme